MSIKSTKTVKRDWAIKRITTVRVLIENCDYRGLVSVSSEENEDGIELFVAEFNYNNKGVFSQNNLNKYTNKMLGNILDGRFFRESYFDNYIVED